MFRSALRFAAALPLLAAVPASAQLVPGPAEGYLIVTTAALAPEFEPLAEWKRRLGLPATVKTMESLAAEYPAASDAAERVRLWIRDQYTGPGARWVLLGGTADHVPTRYVFTSFLGGVSIATDHYFSCLEGTWNADGDALWGEGPADSADLTPEVWVGRAPVTTSAEAHDFVERSVTASLVPVSPRPPRALLAAEVLFPQQWMPGDFTNLDGAELAEPLLPGLSAGGFALRRLYENHLDPRWAPGSELLGRIPFLDAFDDGHDLVLLFDAQSETVLGMGGTEVVDVPDIEALENEEPLSHVYLWGGSGPLKPGVPIGPAFFHAPGGAATVVGTTDLVFPTAIRAYANEYFRLLIDEEVRALGETLGRSRLPFLPFSEFDNVHRWCQMTLTLFGDPHLTLPRRAVLAFAVTAPPTIDVGTPGIPVHVTEDGAPRAGVIVTAYRAAEGIITATTDDQGDAVLPFTAQSPGDISLTARQPGSPTRVTSVEAIVATGVGPVAGWQFAPPRPNPSAGAVWFAWNPSSGVGEAVARLTILDVSGRVVRTWPATEAARTLRWDGLDASGVPVRAGLYVARLEIAGRTLARPVLVTR